MANTKKTGTKEWSDHSYNCCLGCANDCIYCYAREMAVRFKRITHARDWRKEHPRSIKKKPPYHNGRVVMFPTTHDITKHNFRVCFNALGQLLHRGNKVLLVSKPVPELIAEICHDYVTFARQLDFRFTINWKNAAIGKVWEPDAPVFAQRFKALKIAFDAGFSTSISMEPLLEPQSIRSLVELVYPYVTDTIWIGKLNQLRKRVAWAMVEPGVATAVAALESWQTDAAVMQVAHEAKKADPAGKIRWKDSYAEVLNSKETK